MQQRGWSARKQETAASACVKITGTCLAEDFCFHFQNETSRAGLWSCRERHQHRAVPTAPRPLRVPSCERRMSRSAPWQGERGELHQILQFCLINICWGRLGSGATLARGALCARPGAAGCCGFVAAPMGAGEGVRSRRCCSFSWVLGASCKSKQRGQEGLWGAPRTLDLEQKRCGPWFFFERRRQKKHAG